jgi:hypothetical protein
VVAEPHRPVLASALRVRSGVDQMTRPLPPAKRDDWHEFTEDVDDASMCICGVPALTHDAVFPPGRGDG